MELKDKAVQRKLNTPISSIIMYIVAGIIGLIGAVNIYNAVRSFKSAVQQYIAQGYPAAEVNKVLITQQLIPGILEPIGIYFGIAFVIICASIINNKLSNCLIPLSKNEFIEPTNFVNETNTIVNEPVEETIPVEETKEEETKEEETKEEE